MLKDQNFQDTQQLCILS